MKRLTAASDNLKGHKEFVELRLFLLKKAGAISSHHRSEIKRPSHTRFFHDSRGWEFEEKVRAVR